MTGSQLRRWVLMSVVVLSCHVVPRTRGAEKSSLPLIEGESCLDVNVGMTGFAKQVVLGGSELTAAEVDARRTAVALRIDNVYPHGSDFRYDLTFFGLEPGSHNLVDFLKRRDGSSMDDLPELIVTVKSILPPDRFAPSAPETGLLARIGGYRNAVIMALIAWIAGLVAIIFVGRKKMAAAEPGHAAESLSEVDHIRELIQAAVSSGQLTEQQKADLDMRVLSFWRGRRQLEGVSVADGLTILRDDAEAGPLLQGLERWLYSRQEPTQQEVTALLQPLVELTADHVSPAAPPAQLSEGVV